MWNKKQKVKKEKEDSSESLDQICFVYNGQIKKTPENKLKNSGIYSYFEPQF